MRNYFTQNRNILILRDCVVMHQIRLAELQRSNVELTSDFNEFCLNNWWKLEVHWIFVQYAKNLKIATLFSCVSGRKRLVFSRAPLSLFRKIFCVNIIDVIFSREIESHSNHFAFRANKKQQYQHQHWLLLPHHRPSEREEEISKGNIRHFEVAN